MGPYLFNVTQTERKLILHDFRRDVVGVHQDVEDKDDEEPSPPSP